MLCEEENKMGLLKRLYCRYLRWKAIREIEEQYVSCYYKIINERFKSIDSWVSNSEILNQIEIKEIPQDVYQGLERRLNKRGWLKKEDGINHFFGVNV